MNAAHISELIEVASLAEANKKLNEGYVFLGVASKGANGNIYVLGKYPGAAEKAQEGWRIAFRDRLVDIKNVLEKIEHKLDK